MQLQGRHNGENAPLVPFPYVLSANHFICAVPSFPSIKWGVISPLLPKGEREQHLRWLRAQEGATATRSDTKSREERVRIAAL